uniref:Transposase IS116/IS110/IS902 family protein n=1 Tax=Candidatus Kentrum sp. TC TaxID=2126339 RepID=A0A450YWL6_9GAMM|nr:MAG: Transposase IS116/IS110/IS902 family protein [Candidatus Kentron sp. TC]
MRIVLEEYIDAVKIAGARVATITDRMMKVLPQWSLAPLLDSLIALRRIDKISAMVLLGELGDISRFDSPKQLMAYLGLTPSEHGSGKRRRQGAITLTGNSRARRTLVESAWSYRFRARKTMRLKRKAADASEEAKAIAWTAQRRLCGRYATTRLCGQARILNWRVLLLHESWSGSFGTSCARKRQNWLPTEIARQSNPGPLKQRYKNHNEEKQTH